MWAFFLKNKNKKQKNNSTNAQNRTEDRFQDVFVCLSRICDVLPHRCDLTWMHLF